MVWYVNLKAFKQILPFAVLNLFCAAVPQKRLNYLTLEWLLFFPSSWRFQYCIKNVNIDRTTVLRYLSRNCSTKFWVPPNIFEKSQFVYFKNRLQKYVIMYLQLKVIMSGNFCYLKFILYLQPLEDDVRNIQFCRL